MNKHYDAEAVKSRAGEQGALQVLRELGMDPDRGRRNGDELTALRLPPPFNDTNPSVSANLQKWVIKDHGGHFSGSLFELVQQTKGFSFPEAVDWIAKLTGIGPALDALESTRAQFDREPWKHGKVTATYDYFDATGTLVFRVNRYEATAPELAGMKSFRQQKPNGKGGWDNRTSDLPEDVRATPYQLPDATEVIQAGKWLLIAEGEKDVEALRGIGIVATCNAGGAGKWTENHTRHLIANGKPACVLIIPDADEPGVNHALKVAASVHEAGVPVRILKPFGDPGSKQDASDAIADGLTRNRLFELAKKSPLYDSTPPEWAADYVGSREPVQSGQRRRPLTGEYESRTGAYVASGPRIPERVYRLLPEELRAACFLLREGHERDVFLTGLIPCISAAMPNVRTKYSRRWKSLPLMAAVVAPAGSGKGTLSLAADCIEAIDERLRRESENERAHWESLGKDEQKNEPAPPYKRLLIGADASLRAITDALHENEGRGLIFETEIQTLVSTLKQEWGDYISLLLKAAESERYSRNRKGERPLSFRPEIAVVMSGTPRSFTNWLRDTEDGLFSRFLFYAFTAPPEWQNQFADDSDEELERSLEQIGHRLDTLHRSLSGRTVTDDEGNPVPLYFRLARSQQAFINSIFEGIQKSFHGTGQSELLASVKRGAFQAVRIAGTLAAYRLASEGKNLASVTDFEPTNTEVEAAVLLVQCYLKHAAALAVAFAGNPVERLKSEQHRTFYEALPDAFSTADAKEIGEPLQISERQVERLLKDWTETDSKLLIRIRHGEYEKHDGGMAELSVLAELSVYETEEDGETDKTVKTDKTAKPPSIEKAPWDETDDPLEVEA